MFHRFGYRFGSLIDACGRRPQSATFGKEFANLYEFFLESLFPGIELVVFLERRFITCSKKAPTVRTGWRVGKVSRRHLSTVRFER